MERIFELEAYCEICNHEAIRTKPIAKFRTDNIWLPLQGSYFLSIDKGHGMPQPFLPEQTWEFMSCPNCHCRPFLAKDQIRTNKGMYVVGQPFFPTENLTVEEQMEIDLAAYQPELPPSQRKPHIDDLDWERDAEYIKRLEELPADIRASHVDGDWENFIDNPPKPVDPNDLSIMGTVQLVLYAKKTLDITLDSRKSGTELRKIINDVANGGTFSPEPEVVEAPPASKPLSRMNVQELLDVAKDIPAIKKPDKMKKTALLAAIKKHFKK